MDHLSPSHRVLLWRYAFAIWEDGIARMGATFGIVLSFLAAYFAFFAGHNIAFLWLLALLSFVFAGYRAWVRERKAREAAEFDLNRPKLTGFFQDVTTQYVYEKGTSRPIGSRITIYVHIVNENSTRTTLHDFSLTAESGDEKVIASYPEEVPLKGEESLQHEKTVINLVTYLNDHTKQLRKGIGLDGYLTFNLRGFGLPKQLEAEGVVGFTIPGARPLILTLGIRDGLGEYHFINTWGSQPRPSRRLEEPEDDAPYTVW